MIKKIAVFSIIIIAIQAPSSLAMICAAKATNKIIAKGKIIRVNRDNLIVSIKTGKDKSRVETKVRLFVNISSEISRRDKKSDFEDLLVADRATVKYHFKEGLRFVDKIDAQTSDPNEPIPGSSTNQVIGEINLVNPEDGSVHFTESSTSKDIVTKTTRSTIYYVNNKLSSYDEVSERYDGKAAYDVDQDGGYVATAIRAISPDNELRTGEVSGEIKMVNRHMSTVQIQKKNSQKRLTLVVNENTKIIKKGQKIGLYGLLPGDSAEIKYSKMSKSGLLAKTISAGT